MVLLRRFAASDNPRTPHPKRVEHCSFAAARINSVLVALLFVLAALSLVASTPAASAVLHVWWNSPNNGPGNDWAHAYRKVADGLAAASTGDEVRVAGDASHPYTERIMLRLGVALLGGYAADGDTRDPNAYVTILSGSQSGTVVTSPQGAAPTTKIDGFTIRDGKAPYGGGIYCYNSSPTISNNVVTGNSATFYGGGGIYCDSSAPVIQNNLIRGNSASSSTFGGSGAGLYLSASNAIVAGNVIAGNTSLAQSIGGDGAAICCLGGSSAIITNNTIVQNTASSRYSGGRGGGIYIADSSPAISNNIVAFNSSGVFVSAASPVLKNNDVYSNTAYDYSGAAAGTADISADPLFVNRLAGDYHLTAASPCIDAGWNGAQGLPAKDIDGEPRSKGAGVDIGADEYLPEVGGYKDAGAAPNGSIVSISGYMVTAAFDGYFYIEADDRSSGIRVEKAQHGLSVGQRVNVVGTVRTNADFEKYIAASALASNGSGTIEPVTLSNRALGGGDWHYDPATGAGRKGITGSREMNNIGLLVRTWGRVAQVAPDRTWFVIDDGSVGPDSSPILPLVALPAGVQPPDPDVLVFVTGISSCYNDNGTIRPLLRVRTQADVQALQ